MAPGRLTDDTPSSPGGSSYSPNCSSYEVQDEPIHTYRPLRIVVLGAGYSGLLMGMIYNQKLQNSGTEFAIYERNADLGGTWLENRYPGCQCDIPAHNYAYSFEPNPDWPNYYATSVQIHDYMKTVSKKYGVDAHMQFSHEVISAIWMEELGKWRLIVKKPDGETFVDDCDVFINAGGVLNAWAYPKIEGLGSFQGKLLHSARWDETYDFVGKKVAVIGIGSSGVQIVPQVAKVAGHVTSFVRSRTWISPAPGINEPTADDPETDADHNYTQAELDRFHKDPEYLLAHRRGLIGRRIDNFKRNMATSQYQKDAVALFTKSMRTRLGDSEKGKRLADMLIPDFPVGCRRQTPGPGFLEALLQENVDVRWDDINKITEQGIMTRSGDIIEVDAIICATGFDTTFKPRFPILGQHGVDLAKKWEEGEPEAYFGITVPEFPNYFTFIGPNSPISNGSLVLGIQITGVYISKCIEKIRSERIRSMVVSKGACDDYNEHIQEFLKRTVWVGSCRSWYKRGTVDGRVVGIYGGTSFHFTEALKCPRWEDYKFEYVPVGEAASKARRNRFTYLGNGFTKREARKGTVGETQTLTFDEYWDLFNLPDIYS